MDDLKNCPFCGNERVTPKRSSKLFGFNGLGERIEHRTYSVRCNVCFARGGAIGGKVFTSPVRDRPLPEWATTDEELRWKAKILWNVRIDRGEKHEL